MYIYVHMCRNSTHLNKDNVNATKTFTVRTKKAHVFGFYTVIKNFNILRISVSVSHTGKHTESLSEMIKY